VRAVCSAKRSEAAKTGKMEAKEQQGKRRSLKHIKLDATEAMARQGMLPVNQISERKSPKMETK